MEGVQNNFRRRLELEKKATAVTNQVKRNSASQHRPLKIQSNFTQNQSATQCESDAKGGLLSTVFARVGFVESPSLLRPERVAPGR